MFELKIFLRDRLIGRSTFTVEEARIGRSADNEVRLDNPAVSRYHASVESAAGIHVLKDYGSQNGTFVNGERVVGRCGLNDGDRIQIGKFTLAFGTSRREGGTVAPEVADQAEYAVAGKTIALKTPVRERACPWVGYLEEEDTGDGLPRRHLVDRNLFLVGAGKDCQVRLPKRPDRAALVVRRWRGFSLVALAPGVTRNGKPVDLTVDLEDGDALGFGEVTYGFHAGNPYD